MPRPGNGPTTRIHIDTDFAGDPDDACALVMALGWRGAEVVGVTTTADPDGRRAGYVQQTLHMLGRDDIPVFVGAAASLAGHAMGDLPDHERYWGGHPVTCVKPRTADALDLMAQSVEQGATVVAIGPCTNLALLERARPGTLARARVVMMGGWVFPPEPGLPPWGPKHDWNVQCDTEAALETFELADLTLVPLMTAVKATLRRCHLPRLRASGAVGRVLAHQAEVYAVDRGRTEVARASDQLADDVLNFHYDPVTVAVALGWSGADVEAVGLEPRLDDGALRFAPSPEAPRTAHVTTDVDGDGFAEMWLSAVERAQATARPAPSRADDGGAGVPR